MSFWLATINPGRKTRRRGKRKKRRRLSAWQRAVREHGGVMQAVRARRRRKKKIRRRRKASSRRRLRGRPRRNAHGGSSNMARTRRRRRRRARRGRRRRRRNPVWRSRRTGRFKGRPPGRRLRRRRRRSGTLAPGWRNNTYPQFMGNPRRRRRRRRGRRRYRRNTGAVVPVSWNRRRRRRGRRRYRRNAGSVLPVSWNPAGILGGAGSPVGYTIGKVRSLIDVQFWLNTGVPAAAGFFGSKALGATVHRLVTKVIGTPGGAAAAPFIRAGSDAIAGAGLSWAVGRFYSRRAGDHIWLGTVVNVVFTVLKELLGGTSVGRAIGLSGLGQDLSTRMREAVSQRVEQELSGMGTYLTEGDMRRQTLSGGRLGHYMTEGDLRRQAAYGPGPASQADLRDYDVAREETTL